MNDVFGPVVRQSLESEADPWLCQIGPNTSFHSLFMLSLPALEISYQFETRILTFVVNYSKILDFYKHFIKFGNEEPQII